MCSGSAALPTRLPVGPCPSEPPRCLVGFQHVVSFLRAEGMTCTWQRTYTHKLYTLQRNVHLKQQNSSYFCRNGLLHVSIFRFRHQTPYSLSEVVSRAVHSLQKLIYVGEAVQIATNCQISSSTIFHQLIWVRGPTPILHIRPLPTDKYRGMLKAQQDFSNFCSCSFSPSGFEFEKS